MYGEVRLGQPLRPSRTSQRGVGLRLLALGLCLLLLPALATGQTISAVASGNWNSAATWSPAMVPTAANDVIVAGGFTVTVNVATATCLALQAGFSPGTAGTVSFNAGSVLTISGSAGVNIANGSVNMASGGTLKTAGAFTAGSGTVEFNGFTQNIAATTYRHLVLRTAFYLSPKPCSAPSSSPAI